MYVSNYFSNFVTMRVPDEGYRQIRVIKDRLMMDMGFLLIFISTCFNITIYIHFVIGG
jgi:hypothetical protein